MRCMNTHDTRPDTFVSVTFRAPRDLVRAIDEAAQAEALRLALPVDRSAIVRRTLSQAVASWAAEPRPMGMAANVPPTA